MMVISSISVCCLLQRRLVGMIVLTMITLTLHAQEFVSKVWVADRGNGMYKNPVLHADYSDPDAVRVGDDYYMTASSFNAVPGLPVLHSKDLVNWRLIGHALERLPPYDHFSRPQHGNGVWAPAIRYHGGEFYIYYPDPDFGIYLTKARDPAGPWTKPILVQGGKGLIDPCPLWDDDGKVYLVHAFAGSRAGIKSVIIVKELSDDGTKVVSTGKIVYDGHDIDPTIEGPKLYKRNGYYYIFAPAGGVPTGWQTVLRSKSIYGPYDRKVVLDQGNTAINGPHQGAWVDTKTGEDWFLHFQDKEAFGRIVHLQPMTWKNDWPVIGIDKDNDGKGEPVLTYRKPNVGKKYALSTPPDTDEFENGKMGLQWQWQANPEASWSFETGKDALRLYAICVPDGTRNLWDAPNLLLQKFPSDKFSVTTKLTFVPGTAKNEYVGLVIMGLSYGYIGLRSSESGLKLIYSTCSEAERGEQETERVIDDKAKSAVYFRVIVSANSFCNFSYSYDNKKYITMPDSFKAEPGKWIGAKFGLFSIGIEQTNDAGYADVDWVRVEPIE